MSYKNKTATVFGGTGFIGRQVVRELAKLGVTVKIATRIPERAYFLRPCGAVGQIVPFACDYSPEDITRSVKGADYVVNCTGILYEKGKAKFDQVHTEFPESIARACVDEKVDRFVHISALGVEQNRSSYAKSKLAGEQAVHHALSQAIILRPSVVFGPDDSFFNMFASLAMVMPALPLIGGGKTKFQPVYVGDVADAVIAGLTLPQTDKKNPCGQVYELGGPDIVTFKDIYRLLEKYTGRRRPLVPLPFSMAKIQAFFMQYLPKPLLTPDQVESLKYDNVVDPEALNLENLGIQATAMKSILPEYLYHYRAGGLFALKKTA